VEFYEVLDGAIRLKMGDVFSQVVKEKIKSGNFSRNSKETSILLYFISKELEKAVHLEN
jgi:5-bromo-4-chloroindolyl phosphate hydrolysis protein